MKTLNQQTLDELFMIIAVVTDEYKEAILGMYNSGFKQNQIQFLEERLKGLLWRVRNDIYPGV